MREFKAVFLDVDCTLTSEIDGELMPSCLEACQELQAKGIPVIIATGRQGLCVPCIQDGLIKPDYIMGANGSQFYDRDQKLIWSEYIEKELFDEITAFCRKHRVDLFWKFPDAMYAYVGETEVSKVSEETLVNFHIAVHPDPKALPSAGGLVGIDKKTMELFRKQFGQRISCVDGGYYVWDLNNPGTDKGVGLCRMAEMLGIKPEECIAFGDSENDVLMLKAAGLGVAMANGHQIARDSADYITDKASEDGVYKALKKFGIL
ncbi:MAG: HAD family hydrolase [Erysipelotrichaceae bacterium]|nr:HAD family hydrolase [Erysipelotrichaceae bacterium]